MRTGFRCRAYPTPEQAAMLLRTLGCVRKVWNLTLAWRQARWREHRRSSGFTQANAFLTEMKKHPDYGYLAEVSSVPLQQAIRTQQTALGNLFAKRARYPRAARRDHLHRVSTNLVRRHDHVVIEDLAVANMVKNRRLAKAISDAGWGELRRQLAYKCARYGRALTVIDRWHPSSKRCSTCGHLLDTLDLGTRMRSCPGCGTLHDRDLNAAKNILAAGLAVSACGADVRHSGPPRVQSAAKQEPQPARDGTSGP